MFGMRHSHDEERFAVGRHHRGRHRHGFGGRHGSDDGDMMRAGRMLAQGDLRLLALALIAEQPRHGYEIIKVLEEKTSGWYAPSPGIVYPTLTYLEEAGHVTAEASGAKKLYTITDEGRAHLEQNRDFVDAVLERLASVGERARRRRDERDATATARGCRGWCGRRSTICASLPPSGSAATPKPRPRWSRCWRARRRSCAS